MIALRARRQSLQIAQDVNYPQIESPPTWTLPACEVMPQWSYEQNLWGVAPSSSPPQPGWEHWVLAGYVVIVFITVGAVMAYVL